MTRLEPDFREKLWGALSLEPWFVSPGKRIGEVWFPSGELLVKFIYTTEKLSVQVHPGDDYARLHEDTSGKTEMWHILRAAPGAQLALGLRETATRQRLRDLARSGEIEGMLRWIQVAPGDTFFIPPGTIHALGPGIVLCEIQQNVDLTYRLYDYGRPRELHLEKALDVAVLEPHPGRSVPDGNVLVSCRYFVTELHTVAGEQVWESGRERPHLLVVIEGEGTIDGAPFRAGEVWRAPAGATFHMASHFGARVLRVQLP